LTLTSVRTLVAGPPLRKAYRPVVEGPGEPHQNLPEVAEPIACFVHLTDLHVTDAQSPARFEFVNAMAGDRRYRELLTMQRPQEMLNAHAIAAMVRAINDLAAGPLTGAAPQLVVMTGDAIDNAQHNEMANFFALLDGGTVRPDSGAPGYEGVQLASWPGSLFWKPDGPADGDDFQRELGFPRRPGLLDEAVRSFESPGLNVPWLRCYGNHEQVCQGVGVITPGVAKAMNGSRKAVEMPSGIDADTAVETFVHAPEQFLAGAAREVAPDADRRPIARAEFVDPSFYVDDVGDVRFIALDTVCDAGGADGSVGTSQLEWLAAQLDQARDRDVVVLSHHTSDTLANPRGEQHPERLIGLLERSGSVVLWLNGHIHGNRIKAHRGFWEVTTSSIVDWPCQARVVEIFRTAEGQLVVATTMLDHDGGGLAGLHRELAANVPGSGFDSWRPGKPADRNAVLLVPQTVA
jgi:3',5'-cyclic AMP phosphodiesterase CpdA